MKLSKLEILAIVVAVFVGLHFYNKHKLESEGFREGETVSLMSVDGDKPPVIVAFGDALTEGRGADRETSYPAQLSSLLGVRVINEGRAGENSRAALNRFPGVLDRHRPDILLLEVGFEDLLAGRKRSKIEENLDKMVALAKGRGVKVIVLGLPDPDLVDLLITSDLGFYEKVARKHGVLYAQGVFAEALKEAKAAARNYPDAQGYRSVAENLAKYLGEIAP